MRKALHTMWIATALGWATALSGQTQTVDLAAIADLNVTLNDNCQDTLLASELLTGDFDVDGDGIEPLDSFQITVLDDNPDNGPIIDGCGNYTVEITAPDSVLGFQTLSAMVLAEDKTAATLISLPTAPVGLLACEDIGRVDVNALPDNVSRCFRVTGATGAPIAASLDPALAERLNLGGGLPVATDNCAAELEICVSDIVINLGNGPACDGAYLDRFFTITTIGCPASDDVPEEPLRGMYRIGFTTLSLTNLDTSAVQRVRRIDCAAASAAGLGFGEVPAPAPEDYPFFLRRNGDTTLLLPGTLQFCNLLVTHEDSDPIVNCAEEYTVIRTFTLSDWCDSETVRTYTQALLVGDFTAPAFSPATSGPLVVGTNVVSECGAIIRLDRPGMSLTDLCSDDLTLRADIFAADDLAFPVFGGYTIDLANFTAELSDIIPAGDYIVRYTYADACGNSDATDVAVSVVDQSAPAAICEDALTVSLVFNGPGGTGLATISPSTIDAGSRDACSGGVVLAIGEVIVQADGSIALAPGADFGATLALTCDQIGGTTAGLRVRDAAGNVNFCHTELTVHGAGEITCQAPAPVTLACADFTALALLDDLASETPARLDAAFGLATAEDACAATISQQITGALDDCGAGQLVRSFQATAADGTLNQNTCVQVINVVSVPEYTLVLPGDRAGICAEEVDTDAVQVLGGNCDMFMITARSQVQSNGGLPCYDLAVTYSITNLCEYDPLSQPVELSRDFDSDGDTDASTYVHLFTGEPLVSTDDQLRFDGNADRDDGGFMPLAAVNYGINPGRGGFEYTQLIRVSDRTGPEVALTEPADCFQLSGPACLATVFLDFSLTDECTPTEELSPRVELDRDYEAGNFGRTRILTTGEVTEAANGYEITLSGLPVGEHALRITAEDACGNVTQRVVPFCVSNLASPNILCVNQVTTTLQATDDGDATAAIWATDYLPPNTTTCGQLDYSIYTEEEALAPGFQPAFGRDGVIFDCTSDATTPVRVYAFNAAGQSNFCSVLALVQRAEDACQNFEFGTISGAVISVGGEPIAGAEVTLTGPESTITTLTEDNGAYSFEGRPLGEDYTISVVLDNYSRHGRGVSTADLVQITRHILGLNNLDSPYRLLAADANGDEAITVQDIIAVRRLILGLDFAYVNTTPYRFFPANFIFPVRDNPWATAFPEVYNVNNLPGNLLGADHLGIMVGDVSGNGFSGQ